MEKQLVNIGKGNQAKPSINANSLDEMVNSLAILGFSNANTILLTDYKTQNILEYGSRFNSVIGEILDIKAGTAKLNSLPELEKKIQILYSEVNNDTFFGNLSYDGRSIEYFMFFPKVVEFLKMELNKLKQENSAYTGFQNNLIKIGAIGAKGTINFIGCSELANFALSDYHRIVESIMNYISSPEAADLEKIYNEEIPQLQEIANKNGNKVYGEVIYNGKKGEVSKFLYSFGEYLKNKIKSLDRDVGERDKIELIEEEAMKEPDYNKSIKKETYSVTKEPLYKKTEESNFDKKKEEAEKPKIDMKRLERFYL